MRFTVLSAAGSKRLSRAPTFSHCQE